MIATRPATLRYGIAVGAVVAATAARWALEPLLGTYSPYLPFALAVIVASRFGGRGPGLTATALSLVSTDYMFLEPRYSFEVAELHTFSGLALFAVVGTIISFLIGQLRESLISTAEKSGRLEELNTAFEMTHAMVRTLDGIITYWSPGAAAMYGWPPEEAIGRPTHELLKTEFPEPLEKIQERLLERGDWEGELRHHRRDGSAALVASHWSLRRDSQGRPSAVIEVNNDITVLRQTEQALREREEQFRTLANAIPQLCWMANADGWIFWYNQRWFQYTGTMPEQMEGWGWQSVHDPKVLPNVLERWKTSIASGEPFDMTFPLRGGDGAFRPFLTRVMPVHGSDGEVVRWFGTNTDISEQWKVLQALRESEERLAYDLEAMTRLQKLGALSARERDMGPVLREVVDAAIAISGADMGTIQIWDPQSSKLRIASQHGFPKWWLDFWNEVPEGRGSCGTALERGARVIVENVEQSPIFAGTPALEIQLKAGVRAIQSTPLIGRSGKLLGMFSTHYRQPQRPHNHALQLLDLLARHAAEIIEQALAEQALRDSEERLRLAQEAAGIGAFEWNVQTGVNTWTPKLEQMYGLPLGSFGRTQPAWENLVHPEDRALAVERVNQAFESGAPVEGEWRVIWPDGSVHWLTGRFQVFKNDDGAPLRLVGVNIDITERKKAEERLLHAQKLESLGLLAGGVAHDFNNLLVGVIGNASLAREMLPPGHAANELMETVVKTGEQAAHLTRQMLAYSGKGKFLSEPLNISKLVGGIIELVRPSIPKKVALNLDLGENLPSIEADRGQIQQILMNLAINAGEAIGSHDGQITVRTGTQVVNDEYLRQHAEAADLRPGEYVTLEVRDTGSGMDEATKSRIFDPFFSTKFTGRGLGLAAVAGIVRSHKGAIVVTTAPGKGTTFAVLFPPASQPAERSPQRAASAVLQGSGVVLIVDDEQLVRDMAKTALEYHGYTVLAADGGMAAIDISKRYPGKIDLAVLDLNMPGMSGEETLSELRKIRPEVKVFISSGYSESEAMAKFRGQRLVGFIQKPYTSVSLAETVTRALG